MGYKFSIHLIGMCKNQSSGEPINVATSVSPTGPNSNPKADVVIYIDTLDNLTTNLL